MLVELVNPKDPILRQPMLVVPRPDIYTPTIQEEIDKLISALDAYRDCWGIAAPLLGLNHRIFAVRFGGEFYQKDLVFINPEYFFSSIPLKPGLEGCLAIPQNRPFVNRQPAVGIRALDSKGEEFHWLSRTPLQAAAVQHQMDHLNGVLITDRFFSRP